MSSLTFRGLLEIAHETFLLGISHLNLEGAQYPVVYREQQVSCTVNTAMGSIELYTERPSRRTAAARFAQGGAVIVRINFKGREEEFGLVDGQYVDNVERECSIAILA